MKKAFLSGALVMAAASFIAIGAQATSADAALDASTTVDCDGYALTLHPMRDDDGDGSPDELDFKFYTTANVTAKSIPANNKWIKLDDTNSFTLDSAKQMKLFFAESPNPADWTDVLEVVVPAQRKLTGVTYTVGKDTAKDTFLKNAKLGKTPLDDKALDVITIDGVTSLKDYFGSQDYREAQKKGATLSVEYPSDSSIKFTVADSTKDATKPTGHLVATTNEEDTKPAMLRGSLPCTIKIKQAPAAPAVKIDYANHTMALKENQSYAEVDDYDTADAAWYAAETAAPTATWNKVTAKTQNVPVVSEKIYAIGAEKTAKAPKSLLTYISVPSTPTFDELGASVSVIGKALPSGGATKNDTVTLVLAGGKNGLKYQYKIVDKAEEYFDATTGDFKYDKLVGTEKTQAWTTVSVKADKITKLVLKNSGKTEFAGKDILVRVAADKTRFSSRARD